jgi:arginine/lysine/ornithine decarboxylase
MQTLAAEGSAPFHMPGHKRNAALLRDLLGGATLPYGLDFTELPGLDNLQAPVDSLRDLTARAAEIWDSEACFLSVGGSSAGLLAAVRTCALRAAPGAEILVARNCHLAVWRAVEICGLRPVILEPARTGLLGLCGSLPPETLARALGTDGAKQTFAAVAVTSPTYEGVCSDISALAALTRRAGVPLLVDEAHGAHLSPASRIAPEMFPPGALSGGADIVVQSLHKTLPALTQTALIHARGVLSDGGELARQAAFFQGTSPSYLLLGSIDLCLTLLERHGRTLFSRWADRLAQVAAAAGTWRKLRWLEDFHSDRGVFALDPGKLLMDAGSLGLTGPALAERLRAGGIEPEYASPAAVLLMTSCCDREEDVARLLAVVDDLDHAVRAPLPPPDFADLPPLPPAELPPGEAVRWARRRLPLQKAVGELSAAYLWAYPPGVPLLLPGQRVPPELPAWAEERAAAGCPVQGLEEGLLSVLQ